MFNKKSAFTLAEVLLVLAIIGVIAAVTIPAIMQQSSEKKFAALAKKTFSTLQNAINLKIATSPVGPGDLRMGLLEWLLDGEDNDTNTLKVAKVNADSSAIQTPDGVIIFLSSGVNTACTQASTNTQPLGRGCDFYIQVDLNGSDPPTRTTIDNPDAIESQWNEATGYDTIWIVLDSDGKLRLESNGNTTYDDEKRAKKYLGL